MKLRSKIIKEAVGEDKIHTPADIAHILRIILKARPLFTREQEHFFVVGLDGSHKIKFVDLVSLGLVNRALVHPREVFRLSIAEAVSAIIVAHNHPSGNPEPSQDDIAITRQLKEAGQIIGIPVLDHVIFSNEGAQYFSFKERSIL